MVQGWGMEVSFWKVWETGSHSPFKEAGNSRAEKTHQEHDMERCLSLGSLNHFLEVSVFRWAS